MSSMRSASSSTRYFRAGQVRVGAAHVVQQPAGAGDDHVHALAERPLLASHADAAIHGRACQARPGGELLEVFGDLRRQLPRGRKHQRPRGAALLRDELVHDRKEEGGRLAAARLRACKDVLAHERGGNGGGLDVGRLIEAHASHRRAQRLRERKIGECHHNPLMKPGRLKWMIGGIAGEAAARARRPCTLVRWYVRLREAAR